MMIVVADGVCQQITICAANSFNSEMFVTHRDHDADDLMRRTRVRCYLELKLSIVPNHYFYFPSDLVCCYL